MAVINNENYVMIQGWMSQKLNLKGNELIVYAIIYGFSQAEGQRYTGSCQYFADWCNCSKRSVYNILDELVSKGLIFKDERTINGVKFCEYGITNFTSGEKISLGGGEKISPNNKEIDNKDIKENNISNRNIKEKKAYGQFNNVLLTDDEYNKLSALFFDEVNDRIEILSEYIASTGRKYSSHYATILAWKRKEVKKNNETNKPKERTYINTEGMLW
jgi:hypothetical protein